MRSKINFYYCICFQYKLAYCNIDVHLQIEDEAELFEENDNDDNYTNGKPARKKSSKFDRNHACNICQKTFSKRSYVKEHVRFYNLTLRGNSSKKLDCLK